MRPLYGLIAAISVFVLCGWSDEGHHHNLTKEELGSVHFNTSCSKNVTGEFNRAVALLHSFQYEQADGAFTKIAAADPKCAMAQWGVAMTNYHGLWESGDRERGRVAIAKAEKLAETNQGTTPREKAYIDALSNIFKDDGKDKAVHEHAFEQAMAGVQASYPEDSDAAIFHALTLYITAPKTDRTFSNQRKCGQILEPIFLKQPHHPGAAHYIIHCYDNPVLAKDGLTAARAYAKIAPASAHAHHMPSHIFTRVGSWDEAIASNISSAAFAAAAEQTSHNGEARDQRLHAMDYLEYADLQSGRVKQAKAVLDEMNSLPPISGLTSTGNYATAAIPARYAMELHDWKQAASLQVDKSGVPFAQALTLMAIGVGSVRTSNVAAATQAEQRLAALRDDLASQKNTYWSNQVEVQRREVAGWIAQQSGKQAEGVSLMRAAAELEESMDKHPVTPGATIPAREMLAELLWLQHEPKQALSEYEAVLKTAPNRFNAVYGAAMAADAAGEATLASQYFRKLTEIAVGDERPEMATARNKMMAAQ